MQRFITIRFVADNDQNGNPRRVFVTWNVVTGAIVATYEEGYGGRESITSTAHYDAYRGCDIETTVEEYDRLVALGYELDSCTNVSGRI